MPTAAELLWQQLQLLQQQQQKQKEETQPPKEQPPKVIQLPLWPEPVRAVPNGMLRSALFGAIRKGRRRFLKAEQIAALDGIEIRYTGERLDQGDLDVWESVLHAVRTQPLGNKCHVTAYQLLRLMGKTANGKNRKILHERITRLRSGTLEVTVTSKRGRYTYIGGLIDEAYKDELSHEWVIVINPKLAVLYGPDQFTLIDWKVRQSLSGRQLAQWLYGFYSSHTDPYPIKVETLWRLSGSEAKSLRHFREELREALAELQAATGWEWEIDEHDLVYVRKTRMPAIQKKHLLKKTLKDSKRNDA